MTHEQILQAVSDVTGVPKEDIQSDTWIPGSRKLTNVFARQLCMYFAMRNDPREIKQIASFFNKSRGSVSHSCKAVELDIIRDKFRAEKFYEVQRKLSFNYQLLTDYHIKRAITDDLSEVQYEYQDLTSEALKFQTNMTKVID